MRLCFSVILFIFISSKTLFSQDLICKVQVLTPAIQSSDKQIFQALQQAITEFINNRKWTNDAFLPSERIECTFIINIKERDLDFFKATATIQSSRPVYGTSYYTPLLNLIDNDWEFNYVENQPLDFSETEHLSNLTSILAFYANIIIGFDYDSFSMEGGNPYFRKAQLVVDNTPSELKSGWKPYEGTQNRYWLSENLNNSNFKPLRKLLYTYHIKGLDIMKDEIETGRKEILNGIEQLRKVHNDKPNSFLMQVFFNAKSNEVVDIFSQAIPQDKTRVFNILSEIDPGNLVKYEKMIKN